MPIPEWDDIRIFLAVARTGRLLAAARQLELDHSTVSRRIDQLEAGLAIQLFERGPRGTSLTPGGEQLLTHAEAMEQAAGAIGDLRSLTTGTVSGVVRLACLEAFGQHIIVRNLPRLREHHPDLELELIPGSHGVSLARREADIAIGLNRPRRGRLAAAKLTDYRLGLYASPAYLECHGTPATPADLARHIRIGYIEDLMDFPELRSLDRLFGGAISPFRSNSILAQEAAARQGIGIALLHGFSVRGAPDLVPVLPDAVSIPRSYWMTTTLDGRKRPHVRAVMDFVREAVADSQMLFG